MPNWVSNVIIVRPDDAKKLEAFFTVSKEDDQEILSFDFNKIIPVPDTVYNGPAGFGPAWHPETMTLEEYKTKYPDGHWYDWSVANWGCKWNARDTAWQPPENGDDYGVLCYQTPWALPYPVMQSLHNDKGVDFQLYFVEESGEFFGAMPFTADVTYPEYMDDPNGDNNPDAIYELVTGESEYSWLERDPSEIPIFLIERLKSLLTVLNPINVTVTGGEKLAIEDSFIKSVIDATNNLLDSKSGNFNRNVRNLLEILSSTNWVSKIDRVAPFPIGSINVYSATAQIGTLIKNIRVESINCEIGLTEERCNARIAAFVKSRSLLIKHYPCSTMDENLTINDLAGKRLLLGNLIAGRGMETLRSKIFSLLNPNRYPSASDSETISSASVTKVDAIISTGQAIVEIYDELAGFSNQEFLNLLNVYARTNLCHLDDESVERFNPDQIPQLRKLLGKIDVINFKNLVHLGMVDQHFMVNDYRGIAVTV